MAPTYGGWWVAGGGVLCTQYLEIYSVHSNSESELSLPRRALVVGQIPRQSPLLLAGPRAVSSMFWA